MVALTAKNSLKTVIVTGSARGIGLAVAREFHSAGLNVVLNCLKNNTLIEAEAERLNLARINSATAFAADVSCYTDCIALRDYCLARFGRIDALINNAGAACYGLFNDYKPSDFSFIINANLISAMNMSHVVLPHMLAAASGSIVNISSVWGSVGVACESVYSAAKAGLNAFTKSIARENGRSGIRINAIACGAIDTDMNKNLSPDEKTGLENTISLGRFGLPEEIAKIAVFLTSDDASYINGAVITADGGMEL